MFGPVPVSSFENVSPKSYLEDPTNTSSAAEAVSSLTGQGPESSMQVQSQKLPFHVRNTEETGEWPRGSESDLTETEMGTAVHVEVVSKSKPDRESEKKEDFWAAPRIPRMVLVPNSMMNQKG